MLKDKKKYKSTEGWGYALFDSEGRLFKEDVHIKTQACAACHRMVPERDYVFSRTMAIHEDSFKAAAQENLAASKIIQFREKPVKALPDELKKTLGEYKLTFN